MLRRVGTCCVLVGSYDVSYALLNIYIYMASSHFPLVANGDGHSLGPWVMDVLLGAVLLFARHADTDTYWTSKISSGRGSKCSGKKLKHGLENQGILHEIYTAATELL